MLARWINVVGSKYIALYTTVKVTWKRHLIDSEWITLILTWLHQSHVTETQTTATDTNVENFVPASLKA